MTMSPESFPNSPPPKQPPNNPNLIDLEPPNNFPSFEFHLHDPVNILPADQLFSNGKLMPLHLPSSNSNVQPQNAPKLRRRSQEYINDPCLFSPRAPKCSSRWKEMLGLKILNQRQKENHKSVGLTAKNSIKSFLNRTSKSSSVDSSLNLPLLRGSDTESESVSLSSSRLSLSSSSSSHENDELATSTLPRISVSRNLMRKKVETKSVALDSPRMNSSGKIVFNTLERSSSTPSSNYGGRYKNNKGIERCYSANVRITSVPVCSKSGVVFGFPLFSSSQQRKHCLKQKNGNSKKRVEKLTETNSYC